MKDKWLMKCLAGLVFLVTFAGTTKADADNGRGGLGEPCYHSDTCDLPYHCLNGICIETLPGLVFSLDFNPLEAVGGTTYYVSPSGNDTNAGTYNAPFRTIQHAVDIVSPGDKILVRSGIYDERILITTSGTADAPIIIEGEVGAVINGGTRISGWEAAPEIGDGVFKVNHGPWSPRNMTWNGKFIPNLSDSIMESGQFIGMMTRSPDDPFWYALGAHFGNLESTTYVRLKDRQNPEDEDVLFAPKSGPPNRAVVTLSGADFLVIRGLSLRNAYRALLLNNANDNIVEYNRLIGGTQILEVLGDSGRNRFRNNEITLDYYYPHLGDSREGVDVYGQVWSDLKGRMRDGDPNAIRLTGTGADNHFYRNYIHRVFEGFYLSNSGPRTQIYENIVVYTHDSGVELNGPLVELEFFDNILAEHMSGVRIKSEFTEGPAYIYRNRIFNTITKFYSGNPAGSSFLTWDVPGKLYFYHNTASNPHRSFSFNTGGTYSDNPFAVEDFIFINNVFSAPTFMRRTSGWPIPRAEMDYCWIGGSLGVWPEEQRNNIFAEGEEIWEIIENLDFVLPSDSAAREAGIDLSSSFTVAGIIHEALPGMSPGYFTGSAPHMGAVQDCREDEERSCPYPGPCSGIQVCTDGIWGECQADPNCIEEGDPDPEPDNNARLLAPYIEGIDLDGTINAIEWALSEPLIFEDRDAKSQAIATARAAWDEEFLYFGIEISGINIGDSQTRPWNEDSVEIFVDPRADGGEAMMEDDVYFIVSVRGNTYFARGDGEDSTEEDWPDEASYGFTISDDAYMVEFAVAWNFLGLVPENGLEIGLQISVNDRAEDETLHFDWTGEHRKVPNGWGTLRLIGNEGEQDSQDDVVDAASGCSCQTFSTQDLSFALIMLLGLLTIRRRFWRSLFR